MPASDPLLYQINTLITIDRAFLVIKWLLIKVSMKTI